jgi:hypothetical protein
MAAKTVMPALPKKWRALQQLNAAYSNCASDLEAVLPDLEELLAAAKALDAAVLSTDPGDEIDVRLHDRIVAAIKGVEERELDESCPRCGGPPHDGRCKPVPKEGR